MSEHHKDVYQAWMSELRFVMATTGRGVDEHHFANIFVGAETGLLKGHYYTVILSVHSKCFRSNGIVPSH